MDNKTALMYAQLNPYKALVKKTTGFIRWSLYRASNPYLACSFGKDSAVMLHLVLQQKNIPVRFVRWKNETEHIDNYDEVIAAWLRMQPINLTQIELSRESLADKRKDRYNTDQYDSYFIGLRMQESTSRRITLKTHGMFYKNVSGLTRISPLADWTEKDISAYVVANNLPTLNTYKSDGFQARTASRIPRSDHGIRESFITDLKHRDFQAYQKLLLNFPELQSI